MQTSPSCKSDNAFLAVDDVAALQNAADKLSPDIIRERLDYGTFILGPLTPATPPQSIPLNQDGGRHPRLDRAFLPPHPRRVRQGWIGTSE